MHGVDGFMYPNEVELQWSVLIVLYPYITGLVAGAFILASLERVFNVEAVRPTYRLALLTALAFLLVAPLPLQLHLGHPERSLEMYLTPHTSSAMAMKPSSFRSRPTSTSSLAARCFAVGPGRHVSHSTSTISGTRCRTGCSSLTSRSSGATWSWRNWMQSRSV